MKDNADKYSREKDNEVDVIARLGAMEMNNEGGIGERMSKNNKRKIKKQLQHEVNKTISTSGTVKVEQKV